MDFGKPSQSYPIGYVDPGQDAGLIVCGEIYDATTGVAEFIEIVRIPSGTLGAYARTYPVPNGKIYLVIALVFQDVGLTIADTNYAPQTAEINTNSGDSTFFVFDHTAFGHETNLDVRSTLSDLISGSPVVVSTPVMTHVNHGVYLGSFTGVLGHSYSTRTIPYLAGNPDPDRAATIDLFQAAPSAYTALPPDAVIDGQDYLVNGVPTTGTRGVASYSFVEATIEGPATDFEAILEAE